MAELAVFLLIDTVKSQQQFVTQCLEAFLRLMELIPDEANETVRQLGRAVAGYPHKDGTVSEQSLRDKVVVGLNAQAKEATLRQILECVIVAAAEARLVEAEPEQWKLDVNDRYQAAVGVITSLSTAAMVLPVVLLRSVLGWQDGQSIADQLNTTVYAAWACLGGAVFFAIVYYYSSAKWVKLAWRRTADMFWFPVNKRFVETALDVSYFLMMIGFLVGLGLMLRFAVTFVGPVVVQP